MPPPSQSEAHTSQESPAGKREMVWAKVKLAGEAVALNWPMRTFVARSPLMGYEHLPFDQGIRRAHQLIGGRGYLPNDTYREFLAQGRITPGGLKRALASVLIANDVPNSIQVGGQTIPKSEVLLLHLMYGFQSIDPELLSWHAKNTTGTSAFRHDLPKETKKRLTLTVSEAKFATSLWTHALRALELNDPFSPEPSVHQSPDINHHQHNSGQRSESRAATNYYTIGERVHRLTEIDVVEQLNEQMTKWCAAFLDERLSDWHMPNRDRGFYESWRQAARCDYSGWFMEIEDFRRKVSQLSSRPEDVIISSLDRFGIPEEQWSDYLTRHITQLPGWAGLIRWRGRKPEYPWQSRYPTNLLQYLAVRIFYEVEMVQAICSRELRCEGTAQGLTRYEQKRGTEHDSQTNRNIEGVCRNAWRLFHLAQFLEFSADDLRSLSQRDAYTLLRWIDDFPEDQHGSIWLLAYEDVYRQELLRKLASNYSSHTQNERRPNAQTAFCIDVRSEPFRRHLEAQGNYETIGYAGFFGVPIHHQKLAQEEILPLCPVLITPKNATIEVPCTEQSQSTQQYILGSKWHDLGHHSFHVLKSHPITSYMLIDVFGLLFGLAFIGKVLIQTPYRRLTQWFHTVLRPHLATVIPVDKLSTQDIQTIQTQHHSDGSHGRHDVDSRQLESQRETYADYGFALQEKIQVVENGLRLTGLTRNFARLVLFVGHGSTTDNNPYAAALDCGACGGSHGGPNARVLAAMANRPDVRAELRTRGIDIPDDTVFIAGQHDTTMDRITLFNLSDVPDTHTRDLQWLESDLEQAGQRVANERCSRLPNAPKYSNSEKAARHVWSRSGDWSQVRPEWGLSRNAAFIIGKRSLTAGLNLEGRTFLHNYHDNQDTTGKLLETIMTAPLVVAEWISFQYYFSAVDPWAYGSGSKVIHNIVGGIGVMLGSQSDLQTGFPLQTVNNGAIHYHEPMRLLAIIQAPTERISSVIQQHTVLQNFFDHQWVNLIALSSKTGTFSQYYPGGRWDPIPQEYIEAA